MTTSKFRHSQIAELGRITKQDQIDYHYRSATMADGSVGLVYGEEKAGPDDPYLLILDKLMEKGDSIAYTIRPNKQGTGNIIWFNIDRKAAAEELARDSKAATKQPAKTNPNVIAPPGAEETTTPIPPPPAAEKKETVTTPPPQKKEEAPFPSSPPPEQTKGSGNANYDDPWLGYGSRDAMFRAKDQYFTMLEHHKISRDLRNDREFSWRYWFSEARQIIQESGKKLAPNEVAELAWPLAVSLYNRWTTTKFGSDGQIVDVGRQETTQPA